MLYKMLFQVTITVSLIYPVLWIIASSNENFQKIDLLNKVLVKKKKKNVHLSIICNSKKTGGDLNACQQGEPALINGGIFI